MDSGVHMMDYEKQHAQKSGVSCVGSKGEAQCSRAGSGCGRGRLSSQTLSPLPRFGGCDLGVPGRYPLTPAGAAGALKNFPGAVGKPLSPCFSRALTLCKRGSGEQGPCSEALQGCGGLSRGSDQGVSGRWSSRMHAPRPGPLRHTRT